MIASSPSPSVDIQRVAQVRTPPSALSTANDPVCPLPHLPSVLWCGLLLIGVKFALTTAGFERTWRWLRLYAARATILDMVDPALVAAIEHRVATAAALYPGRALCLEQSLALYYLLRHSGISAALRLGVQAYPFLAHAWIEHDGLPVNDLLEHISEFTPIDGGRR